LSAITTPLPDPGAGSLAVSSQDSLLNPLLSLDSYYPHIQNRKEQHIDKDLVKSNAIDRQPSIREKNNRILIVDDEPDLANLFKSGLESIGGFATEVYTDPIKALSDYKPGLYDLLLLDIKMPKMNGLELYQSIRKKEREKNNGNGQVKVCFITAFEEYHKEFERQFPNLELDCFIRKPVSLDKLVHVIASKLNCYG
jgi:two-component system, OmpR family, response regulator ChvI